jgi:hypothetical protein
MIIIHKNEPTKKANGDILFNAYSVMDASAKTLTNISIILISRRLIK